MSDTRSTESFIFAMGEFEAAFPLDRQYAKNHMWARCVETLDTSAPQRWQFGLTAYAVRLLQDVYFLDWEAQPSAVIASRQMIGSIESKKAESDLYAPLAGTLTAINESVMENPSLINADPYGEGWMIEFSVDPGQAVSLLSPLLYEAHLVEAWEVAQRTIKGQANL